MRFGAYLVGLSIGLSPLGAWAQYNGTFTTKNQQGGTVTLTVKQDAQKRVTGTLAGNGATFQLQGQVNADGLVGKLTGPQGSVFIAAELKGEALKVVLAEPGANGQPNLQAARQLAFTRSSASASSAKEKASAPAPAAGGQDDQIKQFLTANAWCGFTYNKTSGTSRTERVVFHPNGVVVQGSGAQTYSSGQYGSVAGQSQGGQQGRWRVQQGMLHLSQDGMNWTPQPLQVTRNSNGSPIIKSGGKEYMVCR